MPRQEPPKVRLNLASNGRSTSVGRSERSPKSDSFSTRGSTRAITGRLTDEDVQEMLRLRQGGMSSKEIADRFTCTTVTVNKRIRELLGVPGRGQNTASSVDRERIELLLAQGWTPNEITRETGRSWKTIDKLREGNDELIKAASQFVAQQRRERRNGNSRTDHPDVVAAVISAARRNGNIVGTAREVGFSEEKVERILLSTDLGCVVYRLWIKAGGGTHDKLVGDVTGDMVALERRFHERFVHFTTLIEDFGLEAVKQWHAEFLEDAKALERIIKRMQSAIDEAEQGE